MWVWVVRMSLHPQHPEEPQRVLLQPYSQVELSNSLKRNKLIKPHHPSFAFVSCSAAPDALCRHRHRALLQLCVHVAWLGQERGGVEEGYMHVH
jgi:hypothetical protein